MSYILFFVYLGTSDGRIGIHFTCAIKQPLLFRPFSKESIYAMEWGPSLSLIKSSFETQDSEEIESESKFSKYVLYAVGGGQIAAMDPNKPDELFYEPFKVSKVQNTGSCILWSLSAPVVFPFYFKVIWALFVTDSPKIGPKTREFEK